MFTSQLSDTPTSYILLIFAIEVHISVSCNIIFQFKDLIDTLTEALMMAYVML